MDDESFDAPLHLASYRECLASEVPPYATEYAKLVATAQPAKYRTVYDFLFETRENVKAASVSGDFEVYRHYLDLHQRGLLHLLDKMLADLLDDYKDVSADTLQELIDGRGWRWLSPDVVGFREKGWQWFKHSKVGFRRPVSIGKTSVDVAFIPRYSERQIHHWDGKCEAYFDATEIGLIFRRGEKAESIGELVRWKCEHPKEKILAVDWGVL